MSQLTSYLMIAVLKGFGLVIAVIVVIGGFIDLVGELNDIGTANYGLADAIAYVLLGMPRVIFEAMPAAALIGALLGLGNLAVHRELVVMRASGVSHYSMLGALALAGFTLLVAMVLLGESLAPSLGAYARELRTAALHDDVELADGESTWLKEGDNIVRLRRPNEAFRFFGGVTLFELDGEQQLSRVARADTVDVSSTNEWVLGNYGETSFGERGVAARRVAELRQTYDLSPDLLRLSVVQEDLLDTLTLERYILYLQSNDLDAGRYLVAYWSRWANIASVVLMVFLALPFVFGGLRSAGAGARLLVGLVVGLGYYVIVQMSINSWDVFNLDPIVVAWAPSVVLLLVTAVALVRIR